MYTYLLPKHKCLIFEHTLGEVNHFLDGKEFEDWSNRLRKDWKLSELSQNNKVLSILTYHVVVRGYEDYLKSLKNDDQEEVKLPGLNLLPPEKLLQLKFTNVEWISTYPNLVSLFKAKKNSWRF